MRSNGIAIIVAATFCGAAPAYADESLPQASWLFIQEAQSATYTDDTLVLSGVAPDLVAFTDRPHRIATRIGLPEFAGFWAAGAESFGEDRPNAGITLETPNGPKTAVIELDVPRVEGETLVYGVTVIGGVLPPAGTQVSLFIDAFPTAVNSQITDSVTQANTKVLGDAPAMAMGNLFQATSQALANAAHNATTAQQQTNVTAQAATTMGVATLYDVDTAASGIATNKVLADTFGSGH